MSEYKDIKNNTYKVIEHCTVNSDDKKRIESEVLEELYNIFYKANNI